MWDPTYPARSLGADVRSHFINWRRFKTATKCWPIISITTYLGRFFLIIGSVVVAIWYSGTHDLTKGQDFLVFLFVLVPAVLAWFFVEHIAWNYDLRKTGISSSRDIWKVSQFPQE